MSKIPTISRTEEETCRVETKLPTVEFRNLEQIEEVLHMSRTQIVRYALALFYWAMKETLEGRTFGTFDSERKIAKEVIVPGLSALAAGNNHSNTRT